MNPTAACRGVARWMLPWWPELRRRWPLIVGVLRGKTVVYQATLGPPELYMLRVDNPRGAVIMDTSITGPTTEKGSMSVGIHVPWTHDRG